MKRLKYQNVFGLLLIMAIVACGVPKDIQNNYWIKYSGEKIERSDSILRIDGYYTYQKQTTYTVYEDGIFSKPKTKHGTFNMNYLFFDDGMYVNNFSFRDSENNSITIEQGFKEIAKNPYSKMATVFANSFKWGTYTIKGDTIITNEINHPTSPKVWIATKEYFRILNDTTIIQFDYDSLEDLNASDRINYDNHRKAKEYQAAHFVKCDVLPPSNSWLKSEKWLWADEEMYDAYMRIIN